MTLDLIVEIAIPASIKGDQEKDKSQQNKCHLAWLCEYVLLKTFQIPSWNVHQNVHHSKPTCVIFIQENILNLFEKFMTVVIGFALALNLA
jgi:hypothetical protein